MVRIWSGTVRLNFFPGHGARYSPERYSEHSPALFRRHDTNTVDTDLQLQVSDVQLKLNPISTSLYVTRRETWTFHGEEKRSSYNYLKSRLTKIYYTWNFKYNFSKKGKFIDSSINHSSNWSRSFWRWRGTLSRAVCHPDRPCQKCKDGEMISLEIAFQNRERVQRSRYTQEACDEYFLVRRYVEQIGGIVLFLDLWEGGWLQ